jgi:hypothetical protein
MRNVFVPDNLFKSLIVENFIEGHLSPAGRNNSKKMSGTQTKRTLKR